MIDTFEVTTEVVTTRGELLTAPVVTTLVVRPGMVLMGVTTEVVTTRGELLTAPVVTALVVCAGEAQDNND